MHRGTKLVLFALGALLMPHLSSAQEVEMSIRNRTGEQLTVFAQWDFGGTRARLGNLGPNQTRTYTTDIRGEQVTVTVQTPGGRGRIGGGRPEWMADAREGEKIEWDIRSTDPFNISYRRVAAVTAGGGGDTRDMRQPRMTTVTLRSQSQIQNAQGTESDSVRALLYREALININEGLRDDTENPMAYLHLGIVQAGLKNYFAADSAFDQAEVLYPAYFDEDLGTGAYRLNAWIEAYDDALANLDAQNLEEALEFFEIANMLYPNRVEAYLNIGVTAGNLGMMAESLEGWRSALAVIESPDGNPGDDATRQSWDTDFWIMAQLNIGSLLTGDGLPGEAVTVYQNVLDRFPENASARSSLAMALAQSGQGDDALSIFDEILAREDAAPLDYYNAGVSLYAADELERAVVGFEKTLARSPMYRDALQNLAQTLSQMENYEAQVLYTARIIELDPFNDYVYLMHATGLAQLGREEEYLAASDVMQALPFVVDQLQLQPLPSGARVVGVAVNKALDPGTTITLQFTFYDNSGNPVGTGDVEVTLSDPDVSHQFDILFEGEMQVLGYSYELIG